MRTLRTLRTNFLGGLYFSRLFRALVFCGSLVRKRAPGVSCSCPVNTGAPVASSTRYLDAMGTSSTVAIGGIWGSIAPRDKKISVGRTGDRTRDLLYACVRGAWRARTQNRNHTSMLEPFYGV